VLHHGACVGADLAAHQLAAQHDIPIVVWPPTKTKFLAPQCLEVMQGVKIMPASPYLMRDRAIAGACEGLVACPKNREPTGLDVSAIGGTWYTINYAQRLGREVVICYPDGGIEKRETKILRRPE
jgi:hypothetical protein